MSPKQFLIYCFFLITLPIKAQVEEIAVANEYYKEGELEKARLAYEKLARNTENLRLIYSNYYATLRQLKQYSEAEKLVKKMVRSEEDNIPYKVDYYVLLSELHGEEKAVKELNSLIAEVKNNYSRADLAADLLTRAEKLKEALQVYEAARKSLNQKEAFALEIAQLNYRLGRKEQMVTELVDLAAQNREMQEEVKNIFQNYLQDDKDFQLLEDHLYARIQKDPDNLTYNELLLWINIQKKRFGKAFMQAKAIDKRNQTRGAKLIEVGKIALSNKDYNNALLYFEYVVKEYKDIRQGDELRRNYWYDPARRLAISTKEEMIKNTYPVEQQKIESLLTDYKAFIKEVGVDNPSVLEAKRSVALLCAFYLDRKDTAVKVLQEVIFKASGDKAFLARTKMDLGDIQLLIGESEEAYLTYAQAEKDMKDDPVGYEAKLRCAKVWYYRGEFQLAQEQLDILKLATTREIANDAMDLSILIQDNTGLDSTEEAMKEYAAIELLLFQNKTFIALNKTDSMMQRYPHHSLTDELFWLQSKIYRKMGNYAKALECLEKITQLYPLDILGDDALYTQAVIFDENIRDNAKAMDKYKEFMIRYPGSIYTAEARKKFRTLRGDLKPEDPIKP